MIHEPSGARGESREERSQLQNKRTAFLRMVESRQFRLWMALETGRLDAFRAEVVRLEIPPEQLLIEVRRSGKWQQVHEQELL